MGHCAPQDLESKLLLFSFDSGGILGFEVSVSLGRDVKVGCFGLKPQ